MFERSVSAHLLMRLKRSCASVVLLALCLIGLSGCFTLPPGTTFKKGDPGTVQVSKRAWVNSVKVTDPAVTNPRVLEDSLRANLTVFLQESGYFVSIDTLPGVVKPEDLVLDFRFSRFWQERRVHPAYFPAALLTLTLYIVFGGPITIDECDVSGSLIVKDGNGQVVAESAAQAQDRENISLYNVVPSGGTARTAMAQELLQKAIQKLTNAGKP